MNNNKTRKKIANTPCPSCGATQGYYTVKKAVIKVDMIDAYQDTKDKRPRRMLVKNTSIAKGSASIYCRKCRKSLNKKDLEENPSVLSWVLKKTEMTQPDSTIWIEEVR